MKIQNFYHSKWFPRIFYKKPDGGRDSGVTAFFLIEWKPVLSICLLRFSQGSREAYHTHAFNALTWWLKGNVQELFYPTRRGRSWSPSIIPKYTPRSSCHKIMADRTTWAFSIRGPWMDTWEEQRGQKRVVLTHGRKIV